MAETMTPIGRFMLEEIRKNREIFRPFADKGLEFIVASELVQRDFKRAFLVDNILTKGEPMVIGGPLKSLKTSLSIDLAVSIASGTPFLGTFKVNEATPVGVISGESGPHTLKSLYHRVCKSKELDPEKLPVHMMFDLPSLQNESEFKYVCDQVAGMKLGAVIIDPLYLFLTGGDDDALNTANLFDVGPMLRRISRGLLDAGATPILIHHFRKRTGRSSNRRPPVLSDLAGAGIGEFVRQWLLVQPRKSFEPATGHSRLWLAAGGSAGHSGTWGVDIVEGVMDAAFQGRTWEVTIRTEAEQRQLDDVSKQQRGADAEAQLLTAFQKLPAGETQSALLEAADLPNEVGRQLITKLKQEGRIEDCKVVKPAGRSTRDYAGYRLVKTQPGDGVEAKPGP